MFDETAPIACRENGLDSALIPGQFPVMMRFLTALTLAACLPLAQYCRKRPPEETPETYAFLQVIDRRTDGFGVDIAGEMVYSGWMFASRPAQNPLEHAIYDVWVLDCRP